jgi:drug/metabolite transporter (DMT)-like permease
MSPARQVHPIPLSAILLIVRPGASILHGGALFGLGAACFYATFQILTRRLRAEDPRVTLFYPAVCGTVLMTVLLPFFHLPTRFPVMHLVLIVLIGILGTAGHFMFILRSSARRCPR